MSSYDEPLHALIRRSLALLRRDHPAGYEEFRRSGESMRITLRVGSEACGVEFAGQVIVSDTPYGSADVDIATDPQTVADVIAGNLTLAGAVHSGRLAVRGTLPAVVRAHDTLMEYLVAAIHSPPQQAMSRSYTAGRTS
ncbi:MAG: hypothetical protein R3258_02860 [Acidimicrobiia bacterium]|nr:hypothetical protein [Acidimicrobiia bacterium]